MPFMMTIGECGTGIVKHYLDEVIIRRLDLLAHSQI